MFRQSLSSILALLFAPNAAPPSARANEPPLPPNHVWKGVVLCTDGPRVFTVLTPMTANGQLNIIALGPRRSDRTDGQSGLMLVEPDPRGITFVIDRVIVPTSSTPKVVGGHYLPARGKFYGGVSDELDGNCTADAQCDYHEADLATGQESLNHLWAATIDPVGYFREMAKAIVTPPKKEPTAKDWTALAIALMFGQASGRFSRGPGSGLQFVATGPGHYYAALDGHGWSGQEAGGVFMETRGWQW